MFQTAKPTPPSCFSPSGLPDSTSMNWSSPERCTSDKAVISVLYLANPSVARAVLCSGRSEFSRLIRVLMLQQHSWSESFFAKNFLLLLLFLVSAEVDSCQTQATMFGTLFLVPSHGTWVSSALLHKLLSCQRLHRNSNLPC